MGGRRQRTCKSGIRKFSSLLPPFSQISYAQITETTHRLRQTILLGRRWSFVPREPVSSFRYKTTLSLSKGLVKMTLIWGCNWSKGVEVKRGSSYTLTLSEASWSPPVPPLCPTSDFLESQIDYVTGRALPRGRGGWVTMALNLVYLQLENFG